MAISTTNKGWDHSSPLTVYRTLMLVSSVMVPVFALIYRSTGASQSYMGFRLAFSIPTFVLFALSFKNKFVQRNIIHLGLVVLYAATFVGVYLWQRHDLNLAYFIGAYMAFVCGSLVLTTKRQISAYCGSMVLAVAVLCEIAGARMSGLYIGLISVWCIASYVIISDRTRARNDLQDSISLLRTTLDSTCDGIIVLDNNGEFKAWNRAFADLLEIPLPAIETGNFDGVVDLFLSKFKDPDSFIQARTRVLAAPGTESRGAYKLRNGKTVEVYYQPLRSGEDIVGRVSTFHDITDITLAQEALERRAEIEKCLAEISTRFATMPLGETDAEINRDLGEVSHLLRFDRAFVYLRGDDWSSAYRAYEWHGNGVEPALEDLKRLPEEVMNMWIDTLASEGIARVSSVGTSEEATAFKQYFPESYKLESTISLPIIREGVIIGILGFDSLHEVSGWAAEDITILKILTDLVVHALDRKKHEANARMQELAMNAASDQIVITDASGNIVFVNIAFERQTGYTFSEVAGKNPRFMKSGKHKPEFYKEMWDTINAGRTWNGEITNRCKNGDLYVEDITITPVSDDSGKGQYFVAIKRNITEKKAYQERLYRLAHHDPLTGLPNRLLFSTHLAQTITTARRKELNAAVLFFDLDRFKNVNDSLGHKAGDMLLRKVSDRLQNVLRKVDTFARMGGDEFIIVTGGISSPDEAAAVADRVLESIAEPFSIEGHDLSITASIGISMYPYDGSDVETLVMNADTAMYRAKERGKNRYHFYTDSLSAAAMDRMELENSLRKALSREEFVLYYQPRVDLKTGDIIGPEALIRWKNSELGLVPPIKFIPLAEETGLIVPIGEWALHEACRQNKEWQTAGLPPMNVAVNVSTKQLHSGLIDVISKALDDTGLAPEFLSIEITETTLMQDPDLAKEVLQQIRDKGVRILVDDFGTGHSSLSYVKQLPVDGLKLDRSFVCEMDSSEDSCVIPQAVIAMGHSLKLKITAEGIETTSQIEALTSLGCDSAQGYLISRPIPADEYAQALMNGKFSEWHILPVAA